MDRVAFSEQPPLRLVRCRDCGLVYRNPVERPHELKTIYARTEHSNDLMRALHETQRSAVRAQARRVRKLLGRRGTGLEVGSYVGAFLAAARDEDLTFEGVDVNASANAFSRSLGLTAHDGELTAFEPGRRFDVVAIWNTFDQLAEPRAALVAAHRLLSDGGLFVVRVPNGEFYVSMREWFARGGAALRVTATTLLAQNNLLTFPYRAGFGVRSLSALLGSAGFQVVRVHGDALVPTADEWTHPWARIEEFLIKKLQRALALDPRRAPWLEVYARAIPRRH